MTGTLFSMNSAKTVPELRQLLPWASERGRTLIFVRTVAEAALMASFPDHELLQPVFIELKRRYPEG
jgi:hypothetical protein